MELERTRKKLHSGLNMTPMIDLVFLLIIFFMLSTSFIRPGSVALSVAGQGNPTKREKIAITILQDRQIALNGTPYQARALAVQLARQLQPDPNQPILLRYETSVSVQELMHVIDLIRLVGGREIRIAQ